MTSWRRAFRGAVAIVLWSIIWVAVDLVFIGLGLTVASVNPFVTVTTSVIGYVIAGLGVYAALIKILSEVTAEEVERGIGSSG